MTKIEGKRILTRDSLTSPQEEIEELRASFQDHLEPGVLQGLAVGEVEELQVEGPLPGGQVAEGGGAVDPVGGVEGRGRPGDLVDGDRRDHVASWKRKTKVILLLEVLVDTRVSTMICIHFI